METTTFSSIMVSTAVLLTAIIAGWTGFAVGYWLRGQQAAESLRHDRADFERKFPKLGVGHKIVSDRMTSTLSTAVQKVQDNPSKYGRGNFG